MLSSPSGSPPPTGGAPAPTGAAPPPACSAPPSRRWMLLCAAAAVAVFAAAAAIALAARSALDERLVGWIATRRTPALTDLSDTMATLGSAHTMVPVSIAAVLLFLVLRRFRAALLLGVAMVVEVSLNPALKDLFALPRPSGALAIHELAEPGFPSGHAMAAATFCAALALIAWPTRWRRLALVAGIAWAILMGLSRVYLGVHWPSDVVGGWAAGVALACSLGAIIGVSSVRSREAMREIRDGPVSESRQVAAASQGARAVDVEGLRVVLFDWGNTLMVDDGQSGPMVEWPRVAAVLGAAETLAALHGRYRLCVATNADESGETEVMAALERVGLARFIHCVFSSRDIGARKPDPAFYAAVLEALRADAAETEAAADTSAVDAAAVDAAAVHAAAVHAAAVSSAPAPRDPFHSADQVVMVGDNYANDIVGALAAGLRAVWLAPAGAPWPDGGAPERASRIASLVELPGLLRRL